MIDTRKCAVCRTPEHELGTELMEVDGEDFTVFVCDDCFEAAHMGSDQAAHERQHGAGV